MKKRIVIVFMIMLALFTCVVGRFSYLSGGREVAQYAGVTGSRTIEVGINRARGVFYDREGRPLVGAREQWAVLCEPMSLNAASAQALREHATLSQEELEQAIGQAYPFLVYVDEPISGVGLTGVKALSRYEGLAQNLIGYIDAQQHGVSGLEAALDEVLYAQGYSYSALFTADAARRALSGYGIAFQGSGRPVEQGVRLSLDREIQKVCDEVADQRLARGAILVSDLQSGQICAWVSRPTYDPENPAASLQAGDAMLNKVLYSYCCGSAFKIIVVAAALEAGVELPQEYECTGGYQMQTHTIGCAKREGHGVIDATTAFAQSCNPYFCALAAQVGAERLMEMAEKFGLGQKTDLGYGIGDSGGQLPLSADLSVDVALANFAIGQGSLLVTPLQMLRIGAIIADGGKAKPLYLFEGITDATGQYTPVSRPTDRGRVISQETADRIAAMMGEVAQTGTGKPAAAAVYQSAVKTSSAQTGIYEQGQEVLHSWVIGFYPLHAPQYAIAVLAEGLEGSYYSAAPVFGEIVDRLYGCGLINSVV